MSKYNYKFDLVLSDIAPNITGVTTIDQENFMIVAESILNFCEVYLKYSGKMTMKFFNGYNKELKIVLQMYLMKCQYINLIHQDKREKYI